MINARDVKAILFVPGNRPDRFDKALTSGAPAIVIDLEDAVAPAEKTNARAGVLAWFSGRSSDATVAAGVRINHCATKAGILDLAGLVDIDCRPDFIVLPKVESAFEVTLMARLLPDVPLFCTIKSAVGLHAAFGIAHASPNVAGLGFGGVDLAADLRCDPGWDALYHARGTLIQAAASASVAALDVPYLNLASDDGLHDDCLRAKAMGFTGKFAIHPKHVAGILSAFAPTAAEIERARKILRAAESAVGNAGRADDRMIDEAVLRSARRILANVPEGGQ